MNKKLIIPSIVLGLLVTGGAAWTATKAANGLGSNMASKLSEKLGVDESQVSSAMDQIREENQAERKSEISSNLDKAVADGVITAEQKQAWLDKHSELEAQRTKEREEYQKWLSDNGIDESKLRDYGVGGLGAGIGGPGHGRGMMNN